MDLDGREVEAVGDPDFFFGGRANRDASLVALTRSTFTSTSGVIDAVFSPSGDRLAVSSFVGAGSAGSALWIQPNSGSGSRQTILESTSFTVDDWSHDGAYLIGGVQEPETGHDVAYVGLGDEADRAPFSEQRIVAGAGLGCERIPSLAPVGIAAPEPLRLIRNWRAELERRSR